MSIQNFYFILLFLINTLYADEDGYVNIPCSEYKIGTVSISVMKGEGMESNIKETVISRKNNQIVLKTVTKNKIYNRENITTIRTYLFENKGTIYSSGEEINNGGYKIKNKNIPDVPICGKVPTLFQYRTVSDSPMSSRGSIPKMRQTVKIHKVGNKKLKFKAGKFEAEIFQRNSKIEVLGRKNAALTKVTSTQYYVKKIGVIKQNKTSAIIMPNNSLIAMLKVQKHSVVIELISYK